MTLRHQPSLVPPSIVTRAAETAQVREAINLARALSRARDTIQNPSAWTRGALARNVLHRAVLPTSDAAECWSASGALVRALHEVLGRFACRSDRERMYDLGVAALWSSLPPDHPRSAWLSIDVDGFNDYPGTEHEDVMALFDRAIANARSGSLPAQVELTLP
jgi:hypothetical protein